MIPTKTERREFLEERRRGVGGSDIAAICGVDPYRDAVDVYLEKTRPVRPEDVEIEGRSIHLWRGEALEPVIRDLYEHLYDRPVQQFGNGSNLKTHDQHDFIRVHLDGRQVSTGDHPFSTTGAWEAKAPSKHGFQKIVESGVERYRIAQVQLEMAAGNYEWATVAIGNFEHEKGPILKIDVTRNNKLINQMIERARRFWHDHVLPREEPDPEDWGGRNRVEMPETEGDTEVIEDPELIRASYRLIRAYLLRNQAKALYSRRKEAFQEVMEERGIEKAEVPGYGSINYGWRSGRTSFDDEKLRKFRPLDPDAVVDFLIEERIEIGGLDADELIEACEIDYDRFTEQYDDYRAFRPYVDADSPSELPEPDELKIEPHQEEEADVD